RNSTVSGNRQDGPLTEGGGGIFNNGAATVTNSTISGNTASFGAGFANSSGTNVTLTVVGSTISGNTTSSGGEGGGIYIYGGAVTVFNSTISGNRGGSAGNGGGGIFNGGSLTVTNSTIAGNSSANPGGGIYVESGRQLRTLNPIIAGTTSSTGPDVYGNLGSQGHNVIGNPQDMSGWVDTDLLHVNPLLGPLQNNGGPTQTMALLADSPALSAGDSA